MVQLATTVSLVAAGRGVAALPNLIRPLVDAAGLATRRLKGPVMRCSIGALTRAGRSPSARQFPDLSSSGTLQLSY
jgi:hypothetical protein